MDILNNPLIAQRYFFPQRGQLAAPYLVDTPVGPLACWRSAAPSERPILVHFHGNGELVEHWIHGFAPFIEACGFDVFLAEYRGYGDSAGTPTLGSLLDDIPHIAAALGVDPSQTVVFGRSVGSIFAIEWVRRFGDCRGLVLESGIHDVFQRLALRIRPDELDLTALESAVRTRIDHRTTLQAYDGPSLILHAEGDYLVEIEHAELNHAAAGERSRLVRMPYGDHNSILAANQALYFEELKTFLTALA